jgi:hypothetical protein
MRAITLAVVLSLSLAGSLSAASVPEVGIGRGSSPVAMPDRPLGQPTARTRADTLWIFDADFADLLGDNAGWFTYDRRGTLGCGDYWHKDTLFTDSFAYLGDSAWWCGTYDECFEQGQGYGNRWTCMLARDFELSQWTGPSHEVAFEFDQRYAIEKDYDYGYVEVSGNGGSTWATIATFTNFGFPGTPGRPRNWPSTEGHQQLNLTAYAGTDIRLRFRFTSDGAYSSEDVPDDSWHAVKNGAWQLDNFVMKSRPLAGAWTTHWSDDCESPGENGWEHSAYDGSDQETAFHRYRYGIDLFTGRYPVCNEPPVGSWVMAAVDPITGLTVDDQDAWLISPPVDISGLTNIVGQWNMWVDLPPSSGELFDLYVGTSDGDTCIAGLFWPWQDEQTGSWYGGPFWGTWTDNWDAQAGSDWLKVGWRLWDDEDPIGPRMGGIFLNRQRVGTFVGGREPEIRPWRLYKDWFRCEAHIAVDDSVLVEVENFDCEAMQLVIWPSHLTPASGLCLPMTELTGNPGFWSCPMLESLTYESGEHFYYIEGFDAGALSVTYPAGAPDEHLEFSVLPLGGDVLLVDKHGGYAPGHDGQYQFKTVYYYETALDILGHTWDRWDWPNYTQGHSPNGPPHMALDSYETVIWFSGDRHGNTLTETDMTELAGWLEDECWGDTRNLVLCGNDLVFDAYLEGGQYSFIGPVMGVTFMYDDVGEYVLDVCDVAGGSDFLTSPGGCSPLAAECPQLAEFDVIWPYDGYSELALSYEGVGSYGAAVARTDPICGYSVVTYGFGIEYMEAAEPEVRGLNGLALLVNLLENTLEYTQTPPDTTPTGVDAVPLRNELSQAYPNPSNPVTMISYAVTDAGPVSIRVFNAAGRVVRTLLEEELPEGRAGTVLWDGRDDRGERCASGVYFYRIESEGFRDTRKMVLLK